MYQVVDHFPSSLSFLYAVQTCAAARRQLDAICAHVKCIQPRYLTHKMAKPDWQALHHAKLYGIESLTAMLADADTCLREREREKRKEKSWPLVMLHGQCTVTYSAR